MSMFMQRFTTETYALLRIVAGFLFFWHGTQKLFGFPIDAQGMPPFVIYGAGPIELVCGLLVFLGLFTRYAAFLCSGLMAFAYWIAHGTNNLFPLVNHGELAILYCFVFLYISANGVGKWGIDRVRGACT